MGLFETLAVLPPPVAPQEQQYPDPPADWKNPNACARELSGMAQRDKWGRIFVSMSGKALPPNVIATGYVRNPATNGYQLIEQSNIPITHEVASMLEVAAQEYAVKLAAQTPVAPPSPVYAPPAPPSAPQAPAPQYAGYAPPGMAPPPAAPQLPQISPPAPQWRQEGPPAINPPEASAPPAPQYASPPAPAAPVATDEKPKRRAGRPTNAERAARAAGAQASAPVGTVAAPAVTSPEDVNRDRGFAIFLDCAPVVGFDADNYDLSDIVEMVRPAFRENHQVEDYSLVDFKGPALLAHYVTGKLTELLKEGDVNLTIHSHTREAHACLGRLIPLAGTVVRGL
jgi:hypothetical protein